ncbi:MAG TPA: hypothetical protein VK994_04835, partial [Bacteroidales bacterium]|nr:hypothetical protein [Bacteroidales bacterium]
SSTATYMNSWEANAMISFRKIKSNNKSLTEKVREVREMMKAIDSNASSQSNSYRDRTIKKYNRMIMR